jgi:uncharacterized protein (TIGR00661 family)
MKILYAASNNYGSKIQLSRFLTAMIGTEHQIRIAAYKRSSPKNVNIDWTLDAMLNIYRPELLSLDNDNLSIYFEQIKSYAPDLIISDLEYFTSIVANELNLKIWQCSSSMINFALTKREKYGLGLFKNYAHVVGRDPVHTQRTVNLIDNSNRNLVYSHYGDTENPPNIQSNFEWVRPYHQEAKLYVPCQHFLTAGLFNNDKRLLDLLKKYPDCAVFMDHCQEQHRNLLVKDIENDSEYYCNLKNSNFFVCQGQISFLADAFYNGKHSLIYPDYSDAEVITNSLISQKLGTGIIMSYSTDILSQAPVEVQPTKSSTVKYLHEYIKEL